MSDEENLTRHTPLSPAALAGRLAVIGGVLFISALAFAYAGGWLTPDRLTPARMVAALSDRGGNPLGHRRNHSKGVFHRRVRCQRGGFTVFSRAHVGRGPLSRARPVRHSGREPGCFRYHGTG